MRVRYLLLMMSGAVASVGGQPGSAPPMIDMHLHALPAAAYGPPPVRTCAGDVLYPAWHASH